MRGAPQRSPLVQNVSDPLVTRLGARVPRDLPLSVKRRLVRPLSGLQRKRLNEPDVGARSITRKYI